MQTDTRIEFQRQDQPQTPDIEINPVGLTVKPIQVEERVRNGQAAWFRLTNCQAWTDWLLVAEALDVGRTAAMQAAHSNRPEGRRYNEEFSDWLKVNRFDAIHKTTRSQLIKCLKHRTEIEAWRAQLTTGERLKLNHPVAVLRRWEKTLAKRPDNAAPKISYVAKLNAALIESQKETAQLSRRLAQEAPFTAKDKPGNQAAVAFRILRCSPSATRAFIRALNKLVREAEFEKRSISTSCW